ncbi:MAG TPA: glutamine synthetase III [Clostridia bacterium]|jgi:glutamine synthetase
MKNLPEIYGSMVFNDSVMKQRLPSEIYKAMKKTINQGQPLDPSIADTVANAMKDWAIEKGATHYSHWFQPMTGITAEKHESFISTEPGGKVIMEFSGKELIKGEPDASSFPSGGIRATFEARGYTTWDPTSYAFVKDNTLYIPTAFCSYSGEVLDKKTPLLRSMDALDKQAKRILKLFGITDVSRVFSVVGSEQEYFLIDQDKFAKRKDLIFSGRTLFGAKPPKGQEMEDHYFSSLKQRVSDYIKDLNEELWKLGIPAKTAHNEVAPSQHELAPIYENTNIATDHNQLIMELMKKVAFKHGLACLLHEKPFAGINGSGKHNNWSVVTDTKLNLFDPGNSPEENALFLLFLTAVIRAVDKHQDLLRVSVASAGNDHRLGANEAPPAIISIYLGDELTEVVESLLNGNKFNKKEKQQMQIGIDSLPQFPKDNTDRNRTSPFAFTGNKFEFRMVGSSFSISGPNIVLNTILAESLDDFATELEQAQDFNEALNRIIKENLRAHKRIIFNGNNYSDEWRQEAERRGLLNLQSTVDALPYFISDKNIELFSKYKVFNAKEIHSRYDILVENYIKTRNIEAITMVDMTRQQIIPAVEKYINVLTDTGIKKKSLSSEISVEFEAKMIQRLSALLLDLYEKVETLEANIKAKKGSDLIEIARYYKDVILKNMDSLRATADELERLTDSAYWPIPTYADILFSV